MEQPKKYHMLVLVVLQALCLITGQFEAEGNALCVHSFMLVALRQTLRKGMLVHQTQAADTLFRLVLWWLWVLTEPN